MKFKKMLTALTVLLALVALAAGCSGLFQWSSGAKKDLSKVEKAVAPLITAADKVLGLIQNDQAFFDALLTGSLQAVGVKLTAAELNDVQNYVNAAKASADVLTKAVNNQPVATSDVQNAVNAATVAVPQLKTKVLANPAVAALYNAYLTGSLTVAPAATTSTPAPAPSS